MSELTGYHYLIAGGIVTLFSLIVYLSASNNSMLFFALVGVVMLIIGFVKLKTMKPAHKVHHAVPQQPQPNIPSRGTTDLRQPNQQEMQEQQMQQAMQQHLKSAKYCYHCGTHIKHEDVFCPACGARQR